ncbi:MAG TPA: patatin-like phospholipase family protein [Virgibacillus sp.]|nr:patatin-like phospholipase family protein [Virgibacillus sp.]
MNINSVFSGGGVKAFAFIGALEALEERNFTIRKSAGTSAGAIIAGLVAAGYSAQDIKSLMEELVLTDLLDQPWLSRRVPLLKSIYLYKKMGIYKGDALENWLREKLALKGVHTFRDLNPDTLKIVTADISLGRLVVMPDDLYRLYQIHPHDFSVAKSLRMSASYPYFFMPSRLESFYGRESLMLDGGILSNFPYWIIGEQKNKLKRPTLGMTLNHKKNDIPTPIKNGWKMTERLIKTMKEAHDTRYVNLLEKNNVIYIPVENIEATDLHIDQEAKQSLFMLGKKHTLDFLKNWPN